MPDQLLPLLVPQPAMLRVEKLDHRSEVEAEVVVEVHFGFGLAEVFGLVGGEGLFAEGVE